MSKSSYLNANVVSTDNIAGWIEKTNQVRDDMGNIAVTVTKGIFEPNTGNAGLTTGNFGIEGVVTANTIAVSVALRGGTVTTPADLTVTSNALFTTTGNVGISAANTLNINSNNTIMTSNLVFNGTSKTIKVDSSSFTVNSGTFTVNSNAAFTSNVSMTGANTTIGDAGSDVLNVVATSIHSANSSFTGALVNITSTNTTIGDAGTDVLNVVATSVHSGNSSFTGALVNITSANTTIGDSSADALNVNAISDFNANVNIDGILTQTANATFSGALVNITGANTTIGDAGTDVLNVKAVSAFTANVNITGANTTIGASGSDVLNVSALIIANANATFNGANVSINGNTTIGDLGTDRLIVNAVLSSDLIPLDSTVDLGSAANTYGNLHSTTIYTKDITASNNATVSNVLTVNTQANTASIMVRNLTATRIPYVGTSGQINDSANLTFSGTGVSVIGSLTANNMTANGTLGVSGAITAANTLSVTGAITASNTLNVTGVITASSNLSVTGAITTSNTLSVAGTITASSNLNVTGSIVASDTLSVTGTITAANLSVSGTFTTSNTLSVTGDISAASKVLLVGSGSRVIASNAGSSNTNTAWITLAVANTTTTTNVVIANTSGLFPGANTSYDFGSTTSMWNNFYAKNAYFDAVAFSGANVATLTLNTVSSTYIPFATTNGVITSSANLTFSGTALSVIGSFTANNVTANGTLGVSGAVTTSNTLSVAGLATLSSANVTGTLAVVGNTALSSNLDIAVNKQIRLGTTPDLLLYSNGTHSYIKENGSGNLKIDTSQLDILSSNDTTTDTMATFERAGAVSLYYNNTKRIETTNSGASITGNLTVSGSATFTGGGTATYDIASAANSTVTSYLFSNGNTIIGDTTSDIVQFNAYANSNFIASANNTYNLGSVNNRWNILYANTVSISNTATYKYHAETSQTATTETVSPTAIATFSSTSYGSAEVTIVAKRGLNRYISKLLIVHDGTTGYATEYGSIATDTAFATYSIDITSGVLSIIATPSSTTSTVFNTVLTLINA